LVRVGPKATYDFDDVLAALLDRLPTTADLGQRLRIECAGVFADTTPSFVLTRLMIGQLVASSVSLKVRLTRIASPDFTSAQTSHDESEARATFCLETGSDRDPDEITNILSLQPTQIERPAEPTDGTNQSPRKMQWCFESKRRRVETLREVVREILGRLDPHVDAVSSLTTHRVDGVLSLIVYLGAHVPELELSLEQLTLVKRLGAEIDLDLISD
jgi:hypothetical protein